MITKQFLKIWLLPVNIINFNEILLIFLILRRSRINEVRLQNLYLELCKHNLLFGREYRIIHFFRRPVWNHIMKINEVKHESAIDPVTHHFIYSLVYTFYVHVISLIRIKRNRN